MGPNTNRRAWMLAAAEALNRRGSWTGRIHIQKHLYITKILNVAEPPFDFVLYDYGPYSFELDEEIIESETDGALGRSYPCAGYGPKYEPTLQGRKVARQLPLEVLSAIDHVAAVIGERNSQDLELIATCLYMEREKQIRNDEEIVDAVHAAKPKYEFDTIREALGQSRQLAAALARG